MDVALLVLDIQKGFISEKARMPVAKHQIVPMLETVNNMIEKADSRGIPVVYIGNEYYCKFFNEKISIKRKRRC